MKPPDWKLPDDPLRFIQACVRNRRVLWTYHVNMRLKGRFIPRKAILDAAESYEIVEAYLGDKHFPSYLVLGRSAGEAFHVLFAADVEGDNVRVVTAYRPSAHRVGRAPQAAAVADRRPAGRPPCAAGQPAGSTQGRPRRATQYPRERSISDVLPLDRCGRRGR